MLIEQVNSLLGKKGHTSKQKEKRARHHCSVASQQELSLALNIHVKRPGRMSGVVLQAEVY